MRLIWLLFTSATLLVIFFARLSLATGDEPDLTSAGGPIQTLGLPTHVANRWAQLCTSLFKDTEELQMESQLIKSILIEMNILEQRNPGLKNLEIVRKLIRDPFIEGFIALTELMRKYNSSSNIKSSVIETLLNTFDMESFNCSDANLKRLNKLIGFLRWPAGYFRQTFSQNAEAQSMHCFDRFYKFVNAAVDILGSINLQNFNEILDAMHDEPNESTPFVFEADDDEQREKLARVISNFFNQKLHQTSDRKFPWNYASKEYSRFFREPCAQFVAMAKPAIRQIDKILSINSETHSRMKATHRRVFNLYKMCSTVSMDRGLLQIVSNMTTRDIAQKTQNVANVSQPGQEKSTHFREQNVPEWLSTTHVPRSAGNIQDVLAESTSSLDPSLNTLNAMKSPHWFRREPLTEYMPFLGMQKPSTMLLANRSRYPLMIYQSGLQFRDPIGNPADELFGLGGKRIESIGNIETPLSQEDQRPILPSVVSMVKKRRLTEDQTNPGYKTIQFFPVPEFPKDHNEQQQKQDQSQEQVRHREEGSSSAPKLTEVQNEIITLNLLSDIEGDNEKV